MSTRETMAPPRDAGDVEMLDPEVVRQVRELTALSLGRLARARGCRYLS